MELKSNQPQKKIINCVAGEEDGHDTSSWTMGELYDNRVSMDFFDDNSLPGLNGYQEAISWCFTALEQSPTAYLMLKEAIDQEWVIVIEDLRGGDYCMDVEERILILNNHALSPNGLASSEYFRNITLVTMTKALRDIWQESRHGGFDEDYAPQDVALLERVRTADLDVVSILSAWEISQEDYPQIWRHILGSEHGDMAMKFSGYLECNPLAQNNSQALVATFKQWFCSAERVNACDHDTLEYLDEVLATTDDVNPFGHRSPRNINVELISSLPNKTAYLQGQGSEILSNPIYSSANNDINEAHLSHIKYDIEAVIVENVAFRDADLARKIFPVETTDA